MQITAYCKHASCESTLEGIIQPCHDLSSVEYVAEKSATAVPSVSPFQAVIHFCTEEHLMNATAGNTPLTSSQIIYRLVTSYNVFTKEAANC